MRFALVFCLTIAVAHAEPAVSPDTNMREIKGQSEVPLVRARLKFKSSRPVCMCAEGMSERDIEQGLAKFKQGHATPDSDTNRNHEASKEIKP